MLHLNVFNYSFNQGVSQSTSISLASIFSEDSGKGHVLKLIYVFMLASCIPKIFDNWDFLEGLPTNNSWLFMMNSLWRSGIFLRKFPDDFWIRAGIEIETNTYSGWGKDQALLRHCAARGGAGNRPTLYPPSLPLPQVCSRPRARTDSSLSWLFPSLP